MYCPTSKNCAQCRGWESLKIIEMPSGSKRRRCDMCGCGIPPYANMQGAGFQSETISHYYVETEGDKNFHMPVQLELCYGCYLKDYALAYPDAAIPVIVNVRDFEDVPQPFEPNTKPVELPAGCFTVYA